MALVAYDASDNESITDEEDNVVNSGGVEIIEKSCENEVLFGQLPQPKAVNNLIDVEEENDEFLLKKETPTEKPEGRKLIRIVAPALKDLDSDEDEPKEKKPKLTSKNSGLFELLPPPKSASSTKTTKSFIPHALQKKKQAVKSKPLIPQKVATKINSKNTTSDDDDDDDIHVEEFDVNTWKQVCGRKTKAPEPIIQVIDQSTPAPNIIDTAPEPEAPYEGLDNEAFKKLVGASRIRRENIKLIDVNESEVMTDEDVLRMKALTDPEAEHKEEPAETVSSMSKKKHHITYLAQQAKANEQELQNRWAANRYSRKQTQAKYGF